MAVKELKQFYSRESPKLFPDAALNYKMMQTERKTQAKWAAVNKMTKLASQQVKLNKSKVGRCAAGDYNVGITTKMIGIRISAEYYIKHFEWGS